MISDDNSLQTSVTAESLISLQKIIKQNISVFNDHNQQCICKLMNAAGKIIIAYDLLFKENFDLFKQNNESYI